MENEIDILEDYINSLHPELLSILLTDRTMTTDSERHNIFWATNDYESMGAGFQFKDEILLENITGEHGNVIQPRVKKVREKQNKRIKKMAEVFTPAWVCNSMINYLDQEWFGRKDVFNTVWNDEKEWKATESKILFPENKTWQEYVCNTILEITCGEAPFLASRYDAANGNPIPVRERIGILDRKLRIVSENVEDETAWIKAAKVAMMSSYGYEWQGDSLLIARENMLWTIIDFYQEKFGRQMSAEILPEFAYIISWNLWQMDGLKFVLPESCKNGEEEEVIVGADTLFPTKEKRIIYCESCKKGRFNKHNGIKCLITDWIRDFDNPRKGNTEFFEDSYKENG